MLLVIYIDNIILLADDPETFITYMHKATTLLKSLGFTIHEGKSLFAPSQRVAFLGFVLDSNTMTASMKSDKAVTVKTAIGQLLRKERPQIREVASVVGLMVSCFPGVKYAPLFYRALENDKTDALKKTGWNNDEHMQISDLTKKDLSWWLENVDHDPCPIIPKEPSVKLKCDSSLEGWGSVIDNSFHYL